MAAEGLEIGAYWISDIGETDGLEEGLLAAVEGDEGTPPADAGSDPVDPPVDIPSGPGDGTCAAPFNINEQLVNNTASFSNDTTGASETLSADDACVGAGLLVTAVPGPDHVYALTMPFRGRWRPSLS